MAILGAQVVFSLVMFTFLHKLAPYYSIGRWMLCRRLYRYLHPTNDELKQLDKGDDAGKPAGKGSGQNNSKTKKRADHKKYAAGGDKAELFTVRRSIPIQLDQTPVEDIDLVPLQYYSEYTWIMDFSMAAIVIYILTEAYYVVAPHRIELNISVLWCMLVMAFVLKSLSSQAWVYMKSQEGGERVLLFTFTFFFLVFAMGILVIGDHIIELGIEEAYDNFSGNALSFLQKQSVTNHGPMSFLTYKIVLAFFGMLIGSLLTFPGLRMAKLHIDTLKYTQGRYFLQLLVQINYLTPLVIALLWLKPLGRDLLCGKHFTAARALIYDDQFDGLRFVIILVACALRLVMMPLYLQSHLNLAHEKIETMKKESGRISNTELQKTVARVFFYLCVVAIQYIAPVFLILFLTCILKTLGEYSWVSLFGETAVQFFSTTPKPGMSYPDLGGVNTTVGAIVDSAADISNTLVELRAIFTPVWYRGIVQYLLWWVATAWFTSTSFGVMYYSQS